MARRTFDVVDVTEILIHWHAGRSISEVAASLGVDRKTIRKYLAPALAAGIVPGGPPLSTQAWAELVAGWFPELADTRLRQVTWPQIGAHHDYIKQMLAAGVTQATIHQRLRDEQDLQASVASLRRYVAAMLPEELRRGQVVVLREEVPPGEEAQIDYGSLGSWVDPVGGRRRRVWAFVMVLCCSRHLFVRPVLTMDQRAWTQAHVAAFEFFGGVPRRLVPDNLRTGVDRPDLYDPKINRSYAELASHYGVLVDPARARKPRDKARVERPIPYVRDSLWRGREFASIQQMQTEALRWSSEVAGQRACRPLGGAAPASVFAAVEAPALLPLPARPFVLATWSTAKVGPDIHAKVGHTLYSIPWRLIGQRLDARQTPTTVQFFHQGQLVATHPTSRRASRPTLATTHPRRSPFVCAPLSGAAPALPRSARPASSWSPPCWRSTPCSGCGPPRVCSAWPTATVLAPSAWRRPVPRRSPPATPPTGLSRASLLLAPRPPRPDRRPATVAPLPTCTAPPSCFEPSSPCPPAPTRPSGHRHRERGAPGPRRPPAPCGRPRPAGHAMTPTTPGPRPTAAYPLPRPADDHDPRFTYGLVFDIADVLAKHGYPRPDYTDWADLMLALFRFIYQPNPQEPSP